MELVIFVLATVGALAGGLGVIASRQPVHSALSLLLVLGSLAVMYLLLAAQFIAVVQVIVYAGAIVVLFLFVIMLLHARSGEGRTEKLRWQRPVSLVLAAVFLAALAYALRAQATLSVAQPGPEFGTVQAVGRTLFASYLLPFEVTSVLLLAGIIAAVVIGRPAARAPARGEPPAKTPVGASRR